VAAPTFTGVALDRASLERKDPAWVAAQAEDRRARMVFATRDGVLLAESDPPRLARLPPSGAAPGLLLGLEAGAPLFADMLAADAAPLPGTRIASLRDAGALLAGPEAGLAAFLVALTAYHRHHGFCANCGAPTDLAEAGFARRCRRCGAHHFPRVDPVVIMLVIRGEEVLLGRQPAWPEHRYSALAGFVSPGESIEAAVLREVEEESGVRARDPRFIASQPWPFPASLMLGFHASADGGPAPLPADRELEDVRWFSREAVLAARAEHPAAGWEATDPGSAALLLPPPIAIARYLLDCWLDSPGQPRSSE
jgi:NAD+ diphosphatase